MRGKSVYMASRSSLIAWRRYTQRLQGKGQFMPPQLKNCSEWECKQGGRAFASCDMPDGIAC